MIPLYELFGNTKKHKLVKLKNYYNPFSVYYDSNITSDKQLATFVSMLDSKYLGWVKKIKQYLKKNQNSKSKKAMDNFGLEFVEVRINTSNDIILGWFDQMNGIELNIDLQGDYKQKTFEKSINFISIQSKG